MQEGMKLCPYCQEEIKAEAIKCRHCGSLLTGGESAQPSTSSTEMGIFAGLSCATHHDAQAIDICQRCKKPICQTCNIAALMEKPHIFLFYKYICRDCTMMRIEKLKLVDKLFLWIASFAAIISIVLTFLTPIDLAGYGIGLATGLIILWFLLIRPNRKYVEKLLNTDTTSTETVNNGEE